MLIVAVLNGWSASVRGKETRTATLVERETRAHKRLFLARKATLVRARARMYRRFIRRHAMRENELLCVGKSLGARNLISYVLNEFQSMPYRKTALVTIDPCWPLLDDWTPNLNDQLLTLDFPIGMAINVFAALPKGEQAGALVQGHPGVVRNIPLNDVDHYSITTSKTVRESVRRSVAWLVS